MHRDDVSAIARLPKSAQGWFNGFTGVARRTYLYAALHTGTARYLLTMVEDAKRFFGIWLRDGEHAAIRPCTAATATVTGGWWAQTHFFHAAAVARTRN